jgi:Tfp pilus assembly protein PilN
MLITNLVYDGERIEIKAEAASFDTAEEIKKALAGSSRFKNISISSVTAVRQGSRVEFGLKMDVGR